MPYKPAALKLCTEFYGRPLGWAVDQNNKIDLCRRVDRVHVHWTLIGESACFVFRIVTILGVLSYATVVSMCRKCKRKV